MQAMNTREQVGQCYGIVDPLQFSQCSEWLSAGYKDDKPTAEGKIPKCKALPRLQWEWTALTIRNEFLFWWCWQANKCEAVY
jgi:hypothetical protein